MKITFHIGAHATDGEKLLRSLLRSSGRLADEGIHVPGPSKFRNILRDVATRLKGDTANPETLDLVLDTILDTAEAEHIVLSYDQFMCGVGMIMAGGGYYARADRTSWLRNIFPGHEVRFAMGLRNPATHVPAVFASVGDRSFEQFMQGVSPLDLLWSRPVRQIMAANPDSPMLVWCNEDTPLIWGEVQRAITGCSDRVQLKGDLDLISTIMKPEGASRLRGYLENKPPETDQQRRRILSAFLEKYVLPEEVVEEIDLPGWTEDLVVEMTETYEEDILAVRSIPGVTFLEP